MAELTSKRAQVENARSIKSVLEDLEDDIYTATNYLADLNDCIVKGKNTNRIYSLEEQLKNCASRITSAKTNISKLKTLSSKNEGIKDFQQ